MNRLKTWAILPIMGLTLTACNTTGLNHKNVDMIPSTTQETSQITVYTNQTQMPGNLKIQGMAKVLNHYPDGSKVPALTILEGLKKQAAVAGGIGLAHVTPGTKQTRADIVFYK